MGALSTRNDDPGARVAPVRRRPRRLRDGRGRRVRRARALEPRRGARRHASTARSPATAATPTRTTSPRRRPAAPARPRACSSRSTTPGSTPADIGHVNAHGTSTPLNDAAEAEAIRKVFGDAPPPVTSTKGVTGHLIGAAGAVEAVAALLADPRRRRAADRQPRADRRRHRPRRRRRRARATIGAEPALSNSFGFGGHNATLVLAPESTSPGDRAAHAASVGRRSDAASAAVARDSTAASVSWFRLAGGKHRRRDRPARGRGASSGRSASAVELGVPVVGVIDIVGRRRRRGRRRRCTRGVSVARALADASGVVPTLLAVVGPCVSGPALLLGWPTRGDDRATRSRTSPGPTSCGAFTGVAVDATGARRRRRARAPQRRRDARRRRRGRRAATRSRRSSTTCPTTTSRTRRVDRRDDPVDRDVHARRRRVSRRARPRRTTCAP